VELARRLAEVAQKAVLPSPALATPAASAVARLATELAEAIRLLTAEAAPRAKGTRS
jgi:hypothetical protein